MVAESERTGHGVRGVVRQQVGDIEYINTVLVPMMDRRFSQLPATFVFGHSEGMSRIAHPTEFSVKLD